MWGCRVEVCSPAVAATFQGSLTSGSSPISWYSSAAPEQLSRRSFRVTSRPGSIHSFTTIPCSHASRRAIMITAMSRLPFSVSTADSETLLTSELETTAFVALDQGRRQTELPLKLASASMAPNVAGRIELSSRWADSPDHCCLGALREDRGQASDLAVSGCLLACRCCRLPGV